MRSRKEAARLQCDFARGLNLHGRVALLEAWRLAALLLFERSKVQPYE